MKSYHRGKLVEVDPDNITVSIYRSDKRILIAIARKHDLVDLKNHPSVKRALHLVLTGKSENRILCPHHKVKLSNGTFVSVIAPGSKIPCLGGLCDSFRSCEFAEPFLSEGDQQ